MEMLGERWDLRVIRGIIVPVYQTPNGSLLPVIGVTLSIRAKPDVYKSAIFDQEAQFQRGCGPSMQYAIANNDVAKLTLRYACKLVVHKL